MDGSSRCNKTAARRWWLEVVTVLLPYGAVEPQPGPGKVHTMQHISTHTPDIHFTLDTGFPTLTGDLGSETNWSRPHVGLTYTHYFESINFE